MSNLFLIGGMKCGSTTLYADLSLHRDIHAPIVKEPTFLGRSDLGDEGIIDLYRKRHRGAEKFAYRMDGSTQYSMCSQIPDAAGRARRVAGADCRIIYIIRDPVSRIVSHYRHLYANGAAMGSLEDALSTNPELLDNTRYASQISPWEKEFGAKNIFVGQFLEYTRNREQFVNSVLKFLNLDPLPPGVTLGGPRNVSAGRRNPPNWVSALSRHPVYMNYVAPRVPRKLLGQIKKSFLYSDAPEAKVVLTPELEARIRSDLSGEIEGIRTYLRSLSSSGD